MEIAVVAIVLLLAGLALGWFAGSRGGAAARAGLADAEARLREADERAAAIDRHLREAEVRLAAAGERAGGVDLLRRTLDEVTRERDGFHRDLVDERARAASAREAADARLAELREAREGLSRQFGEVGTRLLGDAQRAFLERAEQRFVEADRTSGERLKALLAPVETTLKRYEEGVAKVEKERSEAYGNLTGLMDAMRLGQEGVRAEAQRLVNALRAAPKARGRWGEQQLRNVLETCGLSEHTDFEMEVSVSTADGRLRPDAVIRVPGAKSLVIDAKVSLNAYQDAYAAIDEAERQRHLLAHAAAMKAHVTALAAKAYWSQFADAPEFVVMFVPGEHFLAAATDADPTLWDYAFGKRVLLAAPTNLVALARTVAGVWRQEKLATDARRIAELGKEMHERLCVVSGHMRKVGAGLNSAVENYNRFVGSFEGKLAVTGRKFRDLNVDTGDREVEAPPPVEALARLPEATREPAE